MRRLFLVRHAKPLLPDDGKFFVGQIDPSLSSEGAGQAERLRHVFADVPIARAFTSPLARAAETAEILLRGRQTPLDQLEFLREIHLGDWDGRSFDDVRREDPCGFDARGQDLMNFRPPGGESFGDLANRVLPPFFDLLTKAEGDLLFVAHAGVFRAVVCSILHLPMSGMFLFGQAYTGVHIIDDRGTDLRVKRLNWLPSIL